MKKKLEYQKLFTVFVLFPLLGLVFAYLFKKTDIIWDWKWKIQRQGFSQNIKILKRQSGWRTGLF